MKKIIMCAFLFCTNTFAHEFPVQKGECFLVKSNVPQKVQSCIVNSGGGAGGSYTALKIQKLNVLIEESDKGEITLGSDAKSLQEGDFYYRQLKNKNTKISLQKAKTTPAYYCAKQIKGSLDVCYILN
ncbi:hypothetical protein [Acinetobacter modestus]|uniref:hypothetical protein n=1 Tax=Acinetobacter modestus TaxID=1776740 RepID=UPI001F4B8F22|nr:hypothetical protein [Acinetobacter modestus]MCH7330236.1 hypothetical protein [Acinetobacter modestus]